MQDRRTFLSTTLPSMALGYSLRGAESLGAQPSLGNALASLGGQQAAPGDPAARAREVQKLIAQATQASQTYVVVPSSLLPYAAADVQFDPAIRMLRETNLSDQFDVRAYGAAGDGKTDDTPAIQAALDHAAREGGVVRITSGTYRVSSLALRAEIDLIGDGPTTTIVDGVGPKSTLAAVDTLVKQTISGIRVQHSNATAADIDLIDLPRGAFGCRFENIVFVGKQGVTRAGFHLHGEDPATGRPNQNQFNNLLLMCHSTVIGPQVREGRAIWLEGRDALDKRCNVNKVIGGSWNGFGTAVAVEAGNANLFCSMNIARVAGAAFDFRGDRQTFNNFIFGCFVDSTVTGHPLYVESRDKTPHTLVQVFGSSRIERPSDVTQANPRSQYSIFSRSIFLGNSQPDKLAGDRTQVLAATDSQGLLRIMGGTDSDSGGFLASGAAFSRGVSAVSDGGGASAVLRETGTDRTSFRVVTTRDGRNFTSRFQVDETGKVKLSNVLEFGTGMRDSHRSPKTDSPDDWVEISIGGVPYFLPAYRG